MPGALDAALIGAGIGAIVLALIDASSALLAGCAALLLALLALRWLLEPHAPRAAPRGHYERPRHFFLTGCASGIGRHLARAALERGHRVTATDINLAGVIAWAASTEDATRVRAMKLDVTDRNAWERCLRAAAAWAGPIDVVGNIAGYVHPRKIQDTHPRQIDLHVDINLKGVIHGTQLAGAAMAAACAGGRGGGGHVVNVASLGAWAPQSGTSLYQATKAGVRTFSIAADKDLRGAGVRVSVLLPDAVQTPMVELQLGFDEAAMAFSGPILTLADVEDAVFHPTAGVLARRPVERVLAGNFGRSLAAFGDLPGMNGSRLITMVERGMRRDGRRAQEAIRARDGARALEACGLRQQQEAREGDGGARGAAAGGRRRRQQPAAATTASGGRSSSAAAKKRQQGRSKRRGKSPTPGKKKA